MAPSSSVQAPEHNTYIVVRTAVRTAHPCGCAAPNARRPRVRPADALRAYALTHICVSMRACARAGRACARATGRCAPIGVAARGAAAACGACSKHIYVFALWPCPSSTDSRALLPVLLTVLMLMMLYCYWWCTSACCSGWHHDDYWAGVPECSHSG